MEIIKTCVATLISLFYDADTRMCIGYLCHTSAPPKRYIPHQQYSMPNQRILFAGLFSIVT